MKSRHYLLLALAVGFMLLSLCTDQRQLDWLDSFASNLASGFLGSFLTVLLIDRALEQERKQETARVRNIALAQLRPVLLGHLLLLTDWYKAASPERPSHLPSTIPGIFSDDYYLQIRFLDFSREAPVYPATDWFHYTAHQFESFRTQIWRVVDKYAVFLESESLELLEGLANSAPINMIIQIANANLPALDKKHNWRRTYNILYDDSIISEVQRHIGMIRSFLEYYNLAAPNPIEIGDLGLWRENTAPRFGSGRLREEGA